MAAPEPNDADQRAIFFFDVDDCLYPQSLQVPKLMYELLEKFVTQQLSMPKEDAIALMNKYYADHGLTVVGLQKYHGIDPMLYNEQNDGQLPLDDLLSPDEELRVTLQKFDTSKVKLWLFTNAHITHAQRVVKLLGVDDLFEGLTYCDYSDGSWVMKPSPEMFAKAEKEAGASSRDQCHFVDDNPKICQAAVARGWQVVQIGDKTIPGQTSSTAPSHRLIKTLDELHNIYPQFSVNRQSDQC